jgi:hypothetical protein
MLLEFNGVCRHCTAEMKVLLLNATPLGGCQECGEAPFSLRQIQGIVYIVSNPNQTGVKVGLTTKAIEHRLKSLNTTGVPGAFAVVALFPSDRPKLDERKVHEKLRRFRIAKEHFDLEPVEAVLKAYRALNRRVPIFFDSNIEETFRLRLEEARIQMQLRLRGAK